MPSASLVPMAKKGEWASWRMLSSRRSIPRAIRTTSCPLPASKRARWRPTNPVPPVIATLIEIALTIATGSSFFSNRLGRLQL